MEIMPSNASINTNSTRLSLGLSTSREISPIKTKSRNYDTIYINEESLSKFQPIDIKLLKIYTSDENIVISILQYMILRKFFIPVDMIKRYGIPKTVLNNLVYTFEALEIVDYQKRSYNGVRAINLIPAYKQLKLECHIRKIPENFKLDPMLLDAFDERITEINLDFVEELKRKAKRERLNSRGRGQKLEAFNKSLNLTDTSVNTENRTVGSNNTFDSSDVTTPRDNPIKSTKKLKRFVSFHDETTLENERSMGISTLAATTGIGTTMSSGLSSIGLSKSRLSVAESSINLSSNSAGLDATTPLRLSVED